MLRENGKKWKKINTKFFWGREDEPIYDKWRNIVGSARATKCFFGIHQIINLIQLKVIFIISWQMEEN